MAGDVKVMGRMGRAELDGSYIQRGFVVILTNSKLMYR